MPSPNPIPKIRRRILSLLFLMYVVNYLDRANVGFAKIPMMADLGFSEPVFGFGAGVFFVGYLLLQVPGALAVERWSARKWMAAILVAWGLCTILLGFIRTPVEFYLARLLLGAAQAGFYPGVIVYLSHWFPERERARATSGFVLAIPVCMVIGGPLSALMLRIDWLGMPGWRWIYILQGLPAVALGLATLRLMTDRPRDARWLTVQERDWLAAQLRSAAQPHPSAAPSLWRAFRDRNALLLALALSAANVGNYAIVVYMPTLLKQASTLSVEAVTALTALPFCAGMAGVVLAGRSSDHSGERRLHTAIALFAAGLLFAASVIPGLPFAGTLLALCLMAGCAYAWPPPYWVLPGMVLPPEMAAASIGFINALGNLGGFFGPTIVGAVVGRGYSMGVAVLVLAASYFVAALAVLAVRKRAPAPQVNR